jgi:hypothetical protein
MEVGSQGFPALPFALRCPAFDSDPDSDPSYTVTVCTSAFRLVLFLRNTHTSGILGIPLCTTVPPQEFERVGAVPADHTAHTVLGSERSSRPWSFLHGMAES